MFIGIEKISNSLAISNEMVLLFIKIFIGVTIYCCLSSIYFIRTKDAMFIKLFKKNNGKI